MNSVPHNVVALTIYPNPAEDLITVTIVAGIINANILIYDAEGELVYTTHTNYFFTSNAINVAALSNGIYIIRIVNGFESGAASFIINK